MPSIGLTFGGDTSLIDADQATGLRKQTYGGTVQWLSDGILGFEGDFGYAPGFFEREATVPSLIIDSSLTTLTGNVVVAIPKRITGIRCGRTSRAAAASSARARSMSSTCSRSTATCSGLMSAAAPSASSPIELAFAGMFATSVTSSDRRKTTPTRSD